jgi:hypothetical protein
MPLEESANKAWPSPDNLDSPGHPLSDLETGRQYIDANEVQQSGNESSSLPTSIAEIPPASASPAPRGIWERVKSWVIGPRPPRPYVIVPLGGSMQLVPLNMLHKWLPRCRYRICLLLAFYVLWLALLIWIVHSGSTENVTGSVQTLSCISGFW